MNDATQPTSKPPKKIYYKSQYPPVGFYCDQRTWKKAGVLAKGGPSRSLMISQFLKEFIERRAKELTEKLIDYRRRGWTREVAELEDQLHRAGVPLPPPDAIPEKKESEAEREAARKRWTLKILQQEQMTGRRF